MRLPDKKTVALQKSTEKKAEVDEGMKLAKRIDELRQTLSKEENTLAKFRMESVSQVQFEIDSAIKRRDALLDEIEELKRQKRHIEAPKDTEWEALQQSEDRLISITRSLEERESDLEQKEGLYGQKASELSIEEKRIKDKARLTAKSLVESKRNELKTAQILEETEHIKDKVISELEGKSKEFASREAKIATQEREINLAYEDIKQKKRKLINDRILLEDREATLEREYKRLHNG